MKHLLTFLLVLVSISITASAQDADSLKYTVLDNRDFIAGYRGSPGAVLIDVRAARDYRRSRIAGAVNFGWPLPDDFFRGTAAPPAGKAVFLYCYAGFRSRKAAAIFYDHGYRRLYSLKGGFNGWRAAKMPVDKKRHKTFVKTAR